MYDSNFSLWPITITIAVIGWAIIEGLLFILSKIPVSLVWG